jgi:hypothetical protein
MINPSSGLVASVPEEELESSTRPIEKLGPFLNAVVESRAHPQPAGLGPDILVRGQTISALVHTGEDAASLRIDPEALPERNDPLEQKVGVGRAQRIRVH